MAGSRIKPRAYFLVKSRLKLDIEKRKARKKARAAKRAGPK